MRPPRFTVVVFLMSLLAQSSGAGQGINEIRQTLSGSPESPAIGAFLQEAGITDPESIQWRDDIEQVEVETWMRFRDVDRDGDPEMFLALHDQRHVHWFILRPEGRDRWSRPLYVNSSGIDLLKARGIDEQLGSQCPRSHSRSGRIFVFHTNLSDWHTDEPRDRYVVSELVEWKLRETFSTDFGSTAFNAGGWWAEAGERPGEVYFLRLATSSHDDLRRLAPDQIEADPIEQVSHIFRLNICDLNAERAEPPAIDDAMHPEVIMFELGRSRQEVLRSGVFDRLGVDASSLDIFDESILANDDLIESVLSYADIDGDGSLEAWVVLTDLGHHYWLLLDQNEGGTWDAVSIQGPLWLHGSHAIDNNPLLPASRRVNGRTLLVYHSGVANFEPRGRCEVRQDVFLYQDGMLIPIWSEVVLATGSGEQRLSIHEGDAQSVRIEVVTFEEETSGEDQIKQRRVWSLAPGETKLRRMDE